MKNTIQHIIQQHNSNAIVVNQILQELQQSEKAKIQVQGSAGSYLTFAAAEIFKQAKLPILIILEDKEQAAFCLNELEYMFDNKKSILFFPSSSKQPYQVEEVNNANVVLRTETLNQLNSNKKPIIIVSYSEAIFEQVVTRKELINNILNLKVNDKIDIDFLNETLFSYHFKRVDFVTEPGEFSVRGGLVDIFSYAYETPFRISFFDDEVESIRSFDIENQLSIKKHNQIKIIANLDNKVGLENRETLLDYVPSSSVIMANNLNHTQQKLTQLYDLATQTYSKLQSTIKQNQPQDLYCSGELFYEKILQNKVIHFSNQNYFSDNKIVTANQTPQPSFNKQFDLLIEHLNQQHQNNYTNYLICNNTVQQKRFQDIFEDIGKDVHYQAVIGNIHQGFSDHDNQVNYYTDHQIFERYHKFNLRDSFSKKQSITLKELNTLQVGDYVTHIDHGIGKFAGLKKIKNQEVEQEAIKLIYQNKDILYVSIHALHKITKYTGKDGIEPKINKLGSPAWKNLKNKTKTKVKEIAFDLIKLYAKRKTQTGFQYSPDSYLQTELEASFIYEDTPDQLQATIDVKQDMENPKTMDRLICGDVGFGKTEIAIRAAFKAATDGKQVAILVPTTILAFQHHRSFSERLKDMPVRVEYLNRFKTAKQKKAILDDLATGKIDIVIGTHQLVNKNVIYKDLGLLIVDEEHKFGVSVKDKLKTIKANVDTLTLTATPIPRTLQFSLMAARDLSIIKTPPPNRQPIETKLIGFNEEQIRDAVAYEVQRGGQVYVIHNRINTLKEVAGMIQRLVPDAKIATGHGQLEGKKLEELMLDFMQGNFDVLVSTTIVESGLDVPNANTIIINDAQNFGLADLHQMRGRVGRSNKKAFCYLVTPPFSTITAEARKRLQALEQFSDLGSGFNIAMKDLEIRGAGNLLGAEQSGFISDIGFDTYQKILNEAIEELKETDFKELFKHEKKKDFVSDVQIDTDLQLLIPDNYVNNVEERLALYNQLVGIENQEALIKFHADLEDRFGKAPTEVVNLLKSIQLKWICKDLGIERLVLKQGKMLGYFNQKQNFYQSAQFTNILNQLQQHPSLANLKEKPPKNPKDLPTIMIVFSGINGIHQAKESLKQLVANQVVTQ